MHYFDITFILFFNFQDQSKFYCYFYYISTNNIQNEFQFKLILS